MNRLLITIALTITFVTCALAQTTDHSQKIDPIFAQWNKPDSPGCAVSVVKDNQLLLAKGYGMANLEYSVPFTPDTISETGSVAKQFTAASVLLLARRNKLSLDDSVRKHIPELPAFMQSITLRHLISHLSGLRDQNEFFSLMGLPMGSSVHTNNEILELVAKQNRLNFDPGTEYLYNNTAYTMLVHVVSRVSGEQFAEFTRKNIFEPLGMKHTKWRNDFRETVKGRASAYEGDAKGNYILEMPFGNVHGAGGLLTTVGDLQIWNKSLTEGTLDGREFSTLMETRAKLKDGTEIPYALGLTHAVYRGVAEIGHGGATAGYRTYLARYPSEKLSVAMLCNTTNIESAKVAREVAQTFFTTPYKENRLTPYPIGKEDVEKLAGYYLDKDSGEVIRFSEKEGRLYLGFGAGAPLSAMNKSRFITPGATSSYTFEPEGMRVTRNTAPYPPAIFSKLPDATSSAPALSSYTGHFYSAELNVTYVLEIKNGALMSRVFPQNALKLDLIAPDIFLQGGFGTNYRFIRNAKGEITEIEIYTGRVRHFTLRKV